MERPPKPVPNPQEMSSQLGHSLDLPPPQLISPDDVEATVATKPKRSAVSKTIGGAAAKSQSNGVRKRVVRVRSDGKKLAFPAKSHERLPASEVVKEQRGRYYRSAGKATSSRPNHSQDLDPENVDLSRRLAQTTMLGRRALEDNDA